MPPGAISTSNFFLFNTAVPNMYQIAYGEVPEGANSGEWEYSIHDISEELQNSAARGHSPIVRVGTPTTRDHSTIQNGHESSTRGHQTKVSYCRYRMKFNLQRFFFKILFLILKCKKCFWSVLFALLLVNCF